MTTFDDFSGRLEQLGTGFDAFVPTWNETEQFFRIGPLDQRLYIR
jgi:hypothetical protein